RMRPMLAKLIDEPPRAGRAARRGHQQDRAGDAGADKIARASDDAASDDLDVAEKRDRRGREQRRAGGRALDDAPAAPAAIGAGRHPWRGMKRPATAESTALSLEVRSVGHWIMSRT